MNINIINKILCGMIFNGGHKKGNSAYHRAVPVNLATLRFVLTF